MISGRAITPQTPFLLASLSKSFTALATMQLVEAGQVDLDAPVQQYLPWFQLADAEAPAQITVRHLLNQTSGISTMSGNSYLPVTDPSQPDLESFARGLSSDDLLSAPGESWQYSNANYSVLGMVIQAVSGQSYAEYVQQHIFAPLGMQHSSVYQVDSLPQDMASGHVLRFGQAVPIDLQFPQAFQPAGGIISTTEDMSHYLIMMLNQGRYGAATLLSPAGIAQMWQPGDHAQVQEFIRYGMGWFVNASYGISGYDHSGGGGSFHAHMVVTPDSAWGVVVLVNAEHLLLLTKPVEYIAWGVAGLLQDQTLSPLQDVTPALFVASYVIAALQLLSLIWGLFRLRRWIHQPERRPRGIGQVALRIVLPILLNLLAAFIFLFGLPQVVGLPFMAVLYYISDWGISYILSVALALGWLLWGVAAALVLRQRPVAQPAVAHELRAFPGGVGVKR